MIGPHLTAENLVEVLGRAKFRTKKELGKLVRDLNPLPQMPDRIEPMGPASRRALRNPTWEEYVTSLAPPVRELPPGERPHDWVDELDSCESATVQVVRESVVQVELLPVGPVPRDLPPVTGPHQYQVQFSTVEEHAQLVERAKALLARSRPGVTLGELHLDAMKLLVASLEKRKFAVTDRPRARAQVNGGPRTPPREHEHATSGARRRRGEAQLPGDNDVPPRQRGETELTEDSDVPPRQRGDAKLSEADDGPPRQRGESKLRTDEADMRTRRRSAIETRERDGDPPPRQRGETRPHGRDGRPKRPRDDAELLKDQAAVPPRQHGLEGGADLARRRQVGEAVAAMHRDAAPAVTSPRERSRYVPAAERREVYQRDGGRCTYVDARGERCCEARYLEIHHLQPFAKQGAHVASNLTLRCAAHNALAAEEDFDARLLEQRRESTRHEAFARQALTGGNLPD